MSTAPDYSLPLRSARHEAFAKAIARGETADAAYQAAGYRPDRHHAARLATKGHIQARTAVLRAENDRLSLIDREEALRVLADIVRLPIGLIGRDHPLCQEYEEREHGVKVKMPGKIEALRLIGQWCGWEKGTEADRSLANTLAAHVSGIRQTRGK